MIINIKSDKVSTAYKTNFDFNKNQISIGYHFGESNFMYGPLFSYAKVKDNNDVLSGFNIYSVGIDATYINNNAYFDFITKVERLENNHEFYNDKFTSGVTTAFEVGFRNKINEFTITPFSRFNYSYLNSEDSKYKK
ncbi:autotransporter domain-containing protein [Photobacterium damselae subsp. damselae]|uniref:autotransporter domain-containing protein n=1 Tax=Photobacterium damselae TaxID=38293 RepID=UPI001F38A65A|nr:autotransporter domain-containing protein [Photobacterium damselae]UKA23907.1 autotransporter domain-containing protein [Photobacterium damselae subsp. damselae]